MESTSYPGERSVLNPREVAQLAEVRRAGVEQAARGFESFRQQQEGRQDLAWWPSHREPDPCGPAKRFFYRPGELLVRVDALPKVKAVLEALGVKTCQPDSSDMPDSCKSDPIVRILVASRDPVPVLLGQLRCYGLGLDLVGPNHVFFPSQGDPWFSGGGDSVPRQVSIDTDIPLSDRGSGRRIAVFDSNLLEGYKDPRFSWLNNVDPVANQPLEPAPVLPEMLDNYDNHGLFVAGIIGYTATMAKVQVQSVLSESGAVDDGTLAQEISQYLQANSGVRLVNLSLGGTTLGDVPPLALKNCIDTHMNVIFVACAGNNGPGGQAFYPAALPQVVGVGALDGNVPAAFSNTVSAKVWARGVDVVSAFRPGLLDAPPGTVTNFDSGLARWSGTSFSTPRVTGVLTCYLDYLAQTGQPPTGYGALDWLLQEYKISATGLIIIP